MRILKSILTFVESSKDRSWQDASREVHLAINSTVNRITKVSPLQLMIGEGARPFGIKDGRIREWAPISKRKHVIKSKGSNETGWDTTVKEGEALLH
ncbi:unnamed protein product [Euphydryas editha]|uniref:Uncharacterized protein n=1 Tax=Euphydryas editha TaxID=104508 RepID=A0AAU9UC54_EUPED|nr:unnamed protein product [Euphydryas editha]